MKIAAATPSDIEPVVSCWVAAFASDPITGFLLDTGSSYQERLRQFFSLLMRARLALNMPVLVASDATAVVGATMGYKTVCPSWPETISDEWDHFEKAVPGLSDRIAIYDEIAERCKPSTPHYYLGVIGTDPSKHGLGIGTKLLRSFCDRSASDQLSQGVYLETASPSNVRFYERAGFELTGQGVLGRSTLWCMFLHHEPRRDA